MAQNSQTPLPYITGFPAPNVRSDIQATGPELWESLVHTWTELVGYYFDLPPTNAMSPSMRVFLESYLKENESIALDSLGEEEKQLRECVFQLITKKDIEGKYSVVDVLSHDSIWNFVQCYGFNNFSEIKDVIMHLYNARGGKTFVNNLQESANILSPTATQTVCIILLAGPGIAKDWVTVQWFDKLQSLYIRESNENQIYILKLCAASFCIPPLGLLDSNSKIKVLSDVISKSTQGHHELLSALVNHTNFAILIGVPSLTMSLETAKLRIPAVSSPIGDNKHLGKNKGKGKGKGPAQVDDDVKIDEVQMSLVFDLFPNFSQDAVKDLLINHGNSAEVVISYLLENPSEMERYEHFQPKSQNPTPSSSSSFKSDKIQKPVKPKEPSSNNSNLNSKVQRSIYDNDSFDRLQVDSNKILFGKKDKLSLNKLGKAYNNDKTLQATLERIYHADDDEHDDTYDDAEVSHPTAMPTMTDETSAPTKFADTKTQIPSEPAERTEAENTEALLLEHFASHAGEFSKSARRTRARQELRALTGWTDEQIEGWARMLERDPRRKEKLENKYMTTMSAPRNKGLIKASSWRQNDQSDAENSESRSNTPRPRQQQQRKPKTKNQDGENTEAQEKKQNQRKDRNKAKIGNHNRKAGHSKKMERIGGPA